VNRLAVIVLALALVGCGGEDGFLDRYVEDDGRVVRHDQGGDTVSEGQAYAMLLLVAEGDEEGFSRVWAWTREHLRRPDGLLAWRWADGRVADREPAADADLDAARALLLAAERFDEPSYADEGRALGRALAAHETTRAAGRTVLVAGPWARDRAVVNPSYFSPRAFEAISRDDLAASSRVLADRLTADGLPPDWAVVEPWGVAPTSPPAGGEAVYSYDAVRLPIRLAESCQPQDRELAARLWPRLREQPGALPRALDGRPLGGEEHPVALAAAAAAAHAAGDERAASDLLDRAARLDEERPSYYGSAWVALTRAMVDGALGAC
jgi:endo-1,4-beta-D-glucanase Y